MDNLVLCFGEVLWDTFGKIKKAGGAPMNVARHLEQQNVNVTFASRVGTDVLGYELMNFLKDNNLFSELVQLDEELPTCEVTVQLDQDNQATYTIPEPVSWDNIEFDHELEKGLKNVTAIVFGSLASRQETTRNTLLTMLDESKALKVFDVNLRPPHFQLSTIETLAAKANVIKMNEEEADLLIGASKDDLKTKITEFQKTYHNHTIIVTRGGEGAMVWHDYNFYEHPGFKVEVVDTVGAGDAFLATFIAGLIDEQPIPQVLENACAIGAFVTTHRGANPVYNAERIAEIKSSAVSVLKEI